MALRNTFRVGATLQLGADISALGHPVGLGACGMRGTVLVGLALHGAATALVVRITNESWGTGAFVRAARVSATGSGSARSVPTEVDHIAANTRISAESWLAVAHLLVVLRGAQGILATRLSNQTGNLAHVIVAALVVGAIIVRGAFDLPTSGLGIAKESFLAQAVRGMGTSHTFCVPSAGSPAQAH